MTIRSGVTINAVRQIQEQVQVLRQGHIYGQMQTPQPHVQVDIVTAGGETRRGDAARHRETIDGTHILVAAGRRPNLAGLALEAAGIRYGPRGIAVNRRCVPATGVSMPSAKQQALRPIRKWRIITRGSSCATRCFARRSGRIATRFPW